MSKFHLISLFLVILAAFIDVRLVIPAFLAVALVWWLTSRQSQVKIIRRPWPRGFSDHDAATLTAMLLQLPERNEEVAATVVDLYLREPTQPVVVLCPHEGRTQLLDLIRQDVQVEPHPDSSRLLPGTVTFCTTNEYRDLEKVGLHVVVAYAPAWVRGWLEPTPGGTLYYFDEEAK